MTTANKTRINAAIMITLMLTAESITSYLGGLIT